MVSPEMQFLRQSKERDFFGLKAPVVKCHGSSDAKAVYYTIKQVRTMLDTKVVEQLVEAFSPKEEAN